MRSFSTIHGIDVLGYGESFHVSGEGFDWMQLANPVADIARTGITYAQKKEADKQSAAAAEKQANASILADRNATLAASRAAYSGELAAGAVEASKAAPNDTAKANLSRAASAKFAADAAAAQQAMAMQDVAGAGLSPDATAKRIAAAQEEASKAVAEWQASPDDRAKALRATAAQATAMKVANPQMASGTGQVPIPNLPPVEKGSFLTWKVGPLPVWGWGVGAGVLGAVAYFVFGRRQ